MLVQHLGPFSLRIRALEEAAEKVKSQTGTLTGLRFQKLETAASSLGWDWEKL